MRAEHVPVIDRAIYDQLQTTCRPEMLAGLLTSLAVQLREGLNETTLASNDRENVAFHAHAMIAAAGLVGFAELSRACLALETACRSDGSLQTAVDHARVARLRALIELNRLRLDTSAL